MSIDDPRKKGFDYEWFFGDLYRDAQYGQSLTKYMVKVQKYYFDEGLLQPDNAILDEAHKSYVLDRVVGLLEESGAAGAQHCLTKQLLNRPCHQVADWEAMDRYIESFMKLLILWIPLHRSSVLYGFYNEVLFRRYKYYSNCGPAVVEFVDRKHGAHLDKRTIDPNAPGELLLIYHIDQFRRLGGFDVVMRTFTDAKPIGVKFLRSLVRFLWMIKPFYDDQIKKEILPRIPEAAFRSQLLNFDTKNLREVSSNDMEQIFEQMRLILKDTCDVDALLLEHGFAFAQKCLEADILAKRVLGVEWVVRQWQNQEASRAALLHKLQDSSFFEKVFNHSVMKKQIVEKATPLVLWLSGEGALTEQHLNSIFRGVKENRFSEEEVSEALLDLVSKIVSNKGGAKYCEQIWKVMGSSAEFQADSWSPKAIRVLGCMVRADVPAALKDDMVAKLWLLLDDSKLSQLSRVEVVSELAHTAEAVKKKQDEVKTKFRNDGRLIHLQLLAGLAESEGAESCVALFVDIFPAVLASFGKHRGRVMASLSGEDAKPTVGLVIDVHKHVDEIRLRIDLLAKLLRVGHVKLEHEMLKQLWDVVMGLAADSNKYVLLQEERDLALEGLVRLAGVLEGDLALQWLLEFLQPHPVFVSQSRFGYMMYREIFEGVNVNRKALELSAAGRAFMRSLDVIGLELVWGVAITAVPAIAKDAQEYLEGLYLNPAPELRAEEDTLRRRFCAEAMRKLTQLTNDAQIIRVLAMIKSVVEQSMRAEDKAKRGNSGIAAAAAPKVELKDPPIPKWEEKKRQVQEVIDSGMLPDFIPEEYKYVVVCLLFDKFSWMRFDYWAGDLYENPELVLNMVEKSREYKRYYPEGQSPEEKDKLLRITPCSTILATADPVYWDILFSVLEKGSPSVCQLGWEVVSLLDTDKVLHDKFVTLDQKVDWATVFGSVPNYRLLHALQVLERGFIPNRDDNPEELSRKTDWCKRFLRAGGFRYLIGLLHGLAKQQDIHTTSCSTQCLVRILDVVYRFMRSPLPATEFAPEVAAVLQLSTSSENLIYTGPTVEDIPAAMFSLVHAHACSGQGTLGDQGVVGNVALYLLIACLLKVPALWPEFRDTVLTEQNLIEVLTSRNSSFAAVVSERLWYLCRMFSSSSSGESGLNAQTPFAYFLRVLRSRYPQCKAKRHECKAFFALLVHLVESAALKRATGDEWKELLTACVSEILSLAPADDVAEPDEYLAGLMVLSGDLVKVIGIQPVADKQELLCSLLLDKFLYASLAEDGTSTALAKSEHLRKGCFALLSRLTATLADGALLDRAVDTIGNRYMSAPPAQDWKEPVEDDDAAPKTTRFVGLRNMACTCYMNATVQQLFNVTPLVSGILRVATPSSKNVEAEKEAAARAVNVEALSVLADVLRRVVAAPDDELIRLMQKESDEFKVLSKLTYKGKGAVDFLKQVGWVDDGTALILPPTVSLNELQPWLREANDAHLAAKNEHLRLKGQVNTVELFVQFQRMFAYLSKGGARFYDPKAFVANFPDLEGRPVDPRRQEDAFEFFNRLQNILEEQLKGSSQAKIFEELFGVREVQVLDCGKHAKASRPQVAPVVPLGYAPNVMQALDKVYNKDGEWIVGTYKCDECNASVRGRKTMALESTSDYLVIYLKRYDENMQKITTPFEITEELDMRRWSSHVIHNRAGGDPESWKYTLVGTLNHDGVSMNAGHYFSVIRKDDGLWWKFNDTNVTPFRHALTEENIGAECVMLFYRRTKPIGQVVSDVAAVNPELERDVRAENIRLYNQKLLCEKSAFAPLLDFLATKAKHADALPEEKRLWLAQLSVRFVFETLARFRDTPAATFSEWNDRVLGQLFRGNVKASEWLATSLLTDRYAWLLEFLLNREEICVRKAFADLLWQVVTTLTSQDRHLVGGTAAGREASPFFEKGTAPPMRNDCSLVVQLMDTVVSMSEASRSHWRRHNEFWDLIARWAAEGPFQRRHLAVTLFPIYKHGDKYIGLDFGALVLDYFLGQFSVVSKSSMRASIGDRSSLSLQRQFDAWAFVMRTLRNPANKRSPWSLDLDQNGMSVVDGKEPPVPCTYIQDLLSGQAVPEFMAEWIRLGYNVDSTIDVMRHWSWESQDASRVFLKQAVSATQKALRDRRFILSKYAVSVLVEGLAIEDSLQPWRISRVCEGSSETPSIFTVCQQECPGYNKESAEKVIALMAMFAKMVPKVFLLEKHLQERPKLLAHASEIAKEYLTKEVQQSDENLIADATVIIDIFGRISKK